MSHPVMSEGQVRGWICEHLPREDFKGKRLLLVVPDAARQAPMPLLFDALFHHLRPVVAQLDILMALGTRPPMSEAQINELLGISEKERPRLFFQTAFINHEMDNPDELMSLGSLSAEQVHAVSGGRLSEEIPIRINRHIAGYDRLLIVGPVSPDVLSGFHGGNEVLFPEVSGPEFADLMTNQILSGVFEDRDDSPVRAVIDQAAKLVPVECQALLCVVSQDGTNRLHDLFYGKPEDVWPLAAELSARTHLRTFPHQYDTVLVCAPSSVTELWELGEDLARLSRIVADGGELIVYAPEIRKLSVLHGRVIRQTGYHCRAFFTAQREQFGDVSGEVLAHLMLVRGDGSCEDGTEQCRIRVTLASQVSEKVCQQVGLGYREPDSIELEDFVNREDDGVLLVRRTTACRYRLKDESAEFTP